MAEHESLSPPEPESRASASGASEDAAGASAAPTTAARFSPVAERERVDSVDTLRGFSLLGILAMNIYAFAMPFAAYSNPPVYGGSTGINYATWVFTNLFFDQKFMTLFSMLFGAGIVLMSQRAAARGSAIGWLFYRRELWLLLIGLAHGYLLWFGDILFHYAVCGMLIYPLRRRSPRTQIVIGLCLLSVAPIGGTLIGGFFAQTKKAAAEAEALIAAGEELDEAQEASRKAWEEIRNFVEPPAEEIERQVEVYRGGYWEIVKERAPVVFSLQTFLTLTFIIWRAGGLMVIGMALMQLGVFSAQRSRRFYLWCVGLGYGLGLPICVLSAHQLTAHDFDTFYLFKVGGHYNYVGSLLVSCGHLGLLMLICRSGALPKIRARLAAVGRIALTNYLMQTVLLTTLFNGYGLGLYGHLDRFQQMGCVVAVLALELWWSPIWLRHYRFGPFEWVWRSLTFWRRQPMTRSTA